MKSLLATSAAVAAVLALTTPAFAANTAITMWNTADPGGAETAIGTDDADLAVSNFNGVTVTLSSVSKGTSPSDLTEGNIGIRNTTGTIQTLRIIAGANGYLDNPIGFTLTGTIGATLGLSDLSGSFFADAANSLNGQSLSVTGLDIGDFDSGSLLGPKSFSFNGFGPDALTGPYGLAESLTLTLAPGASVFVQGVSMDASAVPEPRTWAMMGIGFALMGLVGWKRRKTARLAFTD
jgi:PEP-CTERM motif